jgi:hypothetical protein
MALVAKQDLSDFGFKQLTTSILTLSGTTNFRGTLKSKGIEIDASPSSSGVTAGALVLSLIGGKIKLAPSGASGSTSNTCFNTHRATTRVGIPSVTVSGACTVTNFLEGYFFPATPPSSSLSISSGGAVRQFGDGTTGNLAFTVIKNTYPFCGNICLDTDGNGSYDCAISAGAGATCSGTVPYTVCGICYIPSGYPSSTSQTYKVCATTTATPESTLATTTITWSNKRFWFKSSTSYSTGSDASIQAILNAGSVIGSELSTSKAKTFSPITFSNEFFYYAYPQTFGVPSFTVNALPNNAWGNSGTGTLFQINYTNTNGYTIPFYVAKSDQRLSASFNIVAS